MNSSTWLSRGLGLVLCGLAAMGAAAVGQRAEEVAVRHVERNQQRLGLIRSDIDEMVVGSQVVSKHNGVTHVYLQQRYRGIDVYAGIFNVNVIENQAVLSSGSRFVPGIAAAAGGQTARRSALQATRAALGHLGLAARRPLTVLDTLGGEARKTTLSDAGVASRPIEAGLVWYPTGGSVRLAWLVEVEEMGGEHWWNAFVDATTGEILGKRDLMIHDSAVAIAAAIARPSRESSEPRTFAPTDGASYNVFPIPLESPNDGGRALVTNVAEPTASPFGWHDTNGAPGPEFTVTRGNNVHAYADRDANNVPDPGSDPNGGGVLSFDFPLDLTAAPLDSQPAIVTNLFYWNNVMHDVTYAYGFNEAAGNFQVNSYGRGGVGNDDVRAEAQDGSGRNNANFGTGVDGVRPRMQMFEWRSALPNPITVHEPSPIAGVYFGPMAGFGGSLGSSGPITGVVHLINDGVPPTSDGCTPFAVPAGAIPLIDRGACTFVTKVKNAQNAGAAVAIVGNNVAGPPIGMGGTDPTITIPSVMISLDDANLFKANLPLTATVEDGSGGLPDRDSDLDAGVIAHEYGHGISNRLTGGPATVACLGNAEQMGEGWSDWFALNVSAAPEDRGSTPRGVGTYLVFQDPDGVGIRPTQYTTDMSVNPSTYASVADVVNISQPHGIGYVWNTMLWDVYWNLVDRYGFNPDLYGAWSTGGNNLAFQLVLDGMKLQPCSPGFVDGRNAILAADLALTAGANQCEIWRGFARRGLGAGASQGSPFSRVDGVPAFDLPAACTVAVFGGFSPPVSAPPAVNAVNAGSTVPVKFTLSGVPGLPIVDTQRVDCDTLEPTGEAPTAPATPGNQGMKRKGDAFHLNWETESGWAGSCRRFTVRIPAASDAVAYFNFF